jgi:hypothetical protein
MSAGAGIRRSWKTPGTSSAIAPALRLAAQRFPAERIDLTADPTNRV